jgi:hypothetical protein
MDFDGSMGRAEFLSAGRSFSLAKLLEVIDYHGALSLRPDNPSEKHARPGSTLRLEKEQ